MKILQINSLAYEAGGTETGIKKLKNELLKRGHDVKIFSSDHGKKDQLFSDFQFKYPHHMGLHLITRLFNIHAYIQMKKTLSKYKPDVIHLHRMDYVSPSVLFLLKNYPTVMTVHGPEDFIKSLLIWFMPHSFFKKNKISKKSLTLVGWLHYIYHIYIQRPIYMLGLKKVDNFITYSTFFSKSLDKEIFPVIAIPNGVDLFTYSKKSHCTYKLLYVGRLDRTKGIAYLIQALSIIIQKYPQTRLSIIGEGIHKQELIALTQKLDLEKHINFIPWQSRDKLKGYYKNSDIVILPSIWPEAFGKVGVEAMSVGRPVIASRVGGIPEWLDHEKTGFLVEPKNSKQIAEKVIQLFSNKKLLQLMGENARKKAEEFNMERFTDKIEHAYRETIKKGGNIKNT